MPMNQCDGCRVGAPLTERGNHAMPDGGLMACTKAIYEDCSAGAEVTDAMVVAASRAARRITPPTYWSAFGIDRLRVIISAALEQKRKDET